MDPLPPGPAGPFPEGTGTPGALLRGRTRLRAGAAALGIGVLVAAAAAFLLRGRFPHGLAAFLFLCYVGGTGILLAVLAPILQRWLRWEELPRRADLGLLLVLFAAPMVLSYPLGRRLLERDREEAFSWVERLIPVLDLDPDGPYPGDEELERLLGPPPTALRGGPSIEPDGAGGYVVQYLDHGDMFPEVVRFRSSTRTWDRYDPF